MRHPCSRVARCSPGPVLLVVTALAACLAVVTPAAAGPSSPAVIGTGQATFVYHSSTQTMEVRLTGSIPASTRVAGTWAAVITGFRQGGVDTVPVPVIPQPWTSSAYSISKQLFYPADSDYGSLTVDLSYTAAGEYVIVRSVHTIEWNPALGRNTTGVDVG